VISVPTAMARSENTPVPSFNLQKPNGKGSLTNAMFAQHVENCFTEEVRLLAQKWKLLPLAELLAFSFLREP
jgi:hypothetical protein